MKYLKLGEKASSFFDPNTQVLIRGNEVVAFERIPQSKKLTVALAQGHVVRATVEDYETYTKGGAGTKEVKIEKKPTAPVVDERLDMNEEEFDAYVEKSGFLNKDKNKVLNAKTREQAITLYDEINKKYED
jgi:hypothetical protein